MDRPHHTPATPPFKTTPTQVRYTLRTYCTDLRFRGYLLVFILLAAIISSATINTVGASFTDTKSTGTNTWTTDNLNNYLPTAATATRATPSTCTVTWTPDAGAPTGMTYTIRFPDGTIAKQNDGTTDATGLTGTSQTITVGLSQTTPNVYTGLGTWESANAVAAVECEVLVAAPNITESTGTATSAAVTWAAPSVSGGITITGYTVTANPGGATCSTTGALTCVLTGLTTDTRYTVTVIAQTSAGNTGSSTPLTAMARTPQYLGSVGLNDQYQLARTDTTNQTITSRSQSPLKSWRDITAGTTHGCGIATSEKLWCWGANTHGQIGDGTTVSKAQPHQLTGDWAHINTHNNHTCGIHTNGTLWCWGANTHGQIGDNTTTTKTTPTAIAPTEQWLSTSPGHQHTCAIRANRTLWCWGNNTDGQLGLGTTTAHTTPQQVGTKTTWDQVWAGNQHTCATHTNGTLWCWGANADGQLGNNTTTNHTTPTVISESVTTWNHIALGATHTCATRTDGSLWCWGANNAGQLGLGNTTDANIPLQVGLETTWTRVAAGVDNTCAVRTNNTVWCWGPNVTGQLGNGTTTPATAPTQTIDVAATRIAVGNGFTLTTAIAFTPDQPTGARAIAYDGQVLVEWFEPAEAEPTITTYQVTASPGGATCTTTSPQTSCIIQGLTNGTTYTFTVTASNAAGTSPPSASVTATPVAMSLRGAGADGTSQIGYSAASGSYHDTFIAPDNLTTGITAAAAGNSHSCAIQSQTLWCWGNNEYGELGRGSSAAVIEESPGQVAGGGTWKAVTAGNQFSCAINTANKLYCFGLNLSGRLGFGNTNDADTPTLVTAGPIEWQKVVAGDQHTCGIDTEGYAWCWGLNDNSQLGHSGTTSVNAPTLVSTTQRWVDIAVGNTTTCGVAIDRSLWCWGDDSGGQAGNGAPTGNVSVPQQIVGNADPWTSVVGAINHFCAVRDYKDVFCWGANDQAQIRGDLGNNVDSPTIVNAAGVTSWQSIAVSTSTTCGTAQDFTLWCWGTNNNGEQGRGPTGYTEIYNVPTVVTGIAARIVVGGGEHTFIIGP